MEVISIEGNLGTVSSQGVQMEVGLEMVEGVAVGDYVIVHAGYALQYMSAEDAKETLAIFDRMEKAW